MKKLSQELLVLNVLLSGQPITPVSAQVNLGCGRLAARIHTLRRWYGEERIKTTMKKVPGSTNKKYASYSWVF